MAEHIKRVAANGELYTFGEFQAWYGEDAEHKWQRAAHITAAAAALAVAATEHNYSELHCLGIPAPCVSEGAQPAAANPANIPEHTNVHATEQVDNAMPSPSTHAVGMQAASSITQPAATEHKTCNMCAMCEICPGTISANLPDTLENREKVLRTQLPDWPIVEGEVLEQLTISALLCSRCKKTETQAYAQSLQAEEANLQEAMLQSA